MKTVGASALSARDVLICNINSFDSSKVRLNVTPNHVSTKDGTFGFIQTPFKAMARSRKKKKIGKISKLKKATGENNSPRGFTLVP